MANSTVAICNIALGNLGANLISSLSETSAESTLCNVHWDNVRRSTLSIHPWNFAIKRAQLSALTNPPVFGYKFAYQLPSTCLRVLRVEASSDYKLEGQQIVTNDAQCFLKYVADITDVSLWTDSFVDLIATRLQLELSYGITKSTSQREQAMNLYEYKLREARILDAQQDIEDALANGASGSLISVRG
jgi:hypothetical protein